MSGPCPTTKSSKTNLFLPVSFVRSHWLVHQPLAVLDLWNNQISERGAEHLSDALCSNQVASERYIFLHLLVSIETLTTVNIGVNPLGAKGAEHFSRVLRQNQV